MPKAWAILNRAVAKNVPDSDKLAICSFVLWRGLRRNSYDDFVTWKNEIVVGFHLLPPGARNSLVVMVTHPTATNVFG